MSIKPVAIISKTNLDRLESDSTATVLPPNWKGVGDYFQLHHIPDTHRVVPVDALNRIMELAGVALVYQPFGTKDRQNFDALLAITRETLELAAHTATASQGGE